MATEKYIERTTTTGGGGGPDNSKTLSAQEYLHSAKVGAGVPFLQATITGLVIAVPFLVLMLKLRVVDAWFWAAGIWAVVQAAVWILTQLHWFSLTNLENLTGIDINKDGVIGDNREPKSVRVDIHEIKDNGHLSVTYATFPVDEMTMTVLAGGLLGGVPFAERYWTGAGKLLSLNQFREIRSEMLKRGLLEYSNSKSPQQGYQLTRGGKAAMRELAGNSPAPAGEMA